MSAATLARFPFVHSDEVWLAWLTRDMVQAKSLAATESFFHLTPRYPHALKTLFHLMQMPFLALSFSVIGARVLSLGAGVACLFFHFKTLRRAELSLHTSAAWTAVLAFDVQFVYASHFARQEVVIMAVMSAALWYVFAHRGTSSSAGANRWKAGHSAAVGAFLGCAMGIHPNAALVAIAIPGAIFALNDHSLSPRETMRHAAVYAAGFSGAAGLFVGVSLVFDPGFFAHYFAFGSAVGVADSPLLRAARFVRFWRKIFTQAAGTYYLPPVRVQLIAFAAAAGAAPVVALRARDRALGAIWATVLLLVGALFLLGKFSPPSASLLWPPAHMLVALLVTRVATRHTASPARATQMTVAVAVVAALFTAAGSAGEVIQSNSGAYTRYRDALHERIPENARVLANLNAGFALPSAELFTYRDLAALPAELSIADYLEREQIEYVVYPSELDQIFAERPVWNNVYGNLYPYYFDLQKVLAEKAVRVAEFETPYAVRLLPYAHLGPHLVTVYRLRRSSAAAQDHP